jgi:soluble lytic murein transglycosylase
MNSTSLRVAILAGLGLAALAGAWTARAAPARPSPLRVLSAADHDIFARAYEAAGRGDWVGARALAAQGSNPVARQLLEWDYARQGNASFDEIDAVLKSNTDWPGRGTLHARAEQALPQEMGESEIIAWFAGHTPTTSIGKVRLGEALIDAGQNSNQTTKGRTLVREGWVAGSFDPATELAIVQKDGAFITQADDRARLENLIWRGQTTAAKRELARIDGSTVAARARIALTAGLLAAKAALAAAQGSDDPELLFDWATALRRDGQDDEAHAMLLRVPAPALLKAHADRWWSEHNIQARDALTAGDPQMALRLVNHAALRATDGTYYEQQFLGGFIQLRFLKDARAALPWFQRMEAAVGRPISTAKAQYWQGRALAAQGDSAAAMVQYRKAATHPETFYGQLALAKTGGLVHLDEAAIEAAPESELDAGALMPAIRILAELGQASDLRLFVTADTAANTSPRHLKRLMIALTRWGYPEIALRLAKTLGYDGKLVLAYSHPVIALPAYGGAGAGPAPALVLGLIRQESEFNPYAVSSAGAQGIMQMMPASARTQARAAGIPYRPDALVGDPAYSIQLGMTEFASHMARYGGSIVLAIASYNAGPNNAARWIKANGDPRLPGVDPIDWIERISYPETRNYVARVLENAQAYRARLAGKDVPVTLLDDLYAPNPPPSPTGP